MNHQELFEHFIPEESIHKTIKENDLNIGLVVDNIQVKFEHTSNFMLYMLSRST